MRLTVMDEPLERLVVELGSPFEAALTPDSIARTSAILWGEHCTDCANPTCYTTCSLYTPRSDLKCRRMVHGLRPRLPVRGGQTGRPLLEAQFRRWGKLEGEGSAATMPVKVVGWLGRVDEAIGRLLGAPRLPFTLRRVGIKVWNRAKRSLLSRLGDLTQSEGFLLEVINLSRQSAAVTLSVFSGDSATHKYETRLELPSGFSRRLIPAQEISALVPLGRHVRVAIESASDDLPHLALLHADFVVGAQAHSPQAAQHPKQADAGKRPGIKCVVWDLDNTLWKGVLVEDGAEGLVFDPRVAAAIVEFDRRGVLNSIASKNDLDLVRPLLERAGLWDYFLCPQVHWQPKSASMAAIAKALNIATDTFVLVDDQPFERSEVTSALPMVEAFDILDLEALLASRRLPDTVTEESRSRRKMYQEEQARGVVLASTGGDYAAFLKSCGIELHLDRLNDGNALRVFELTERTNQLNYSARRFTRPEIDALRTGTTGKEGLVLSANDKFGSYGIIGFAVLDSQRWEVESFFMSCRVQRKKVDHAFFDWLCREGARRGQPELRVRFVPTNRNAPSRVVLADEMKFAVAEAGEAQSIYAVSTDYQVPDAGVVALFAKTELITAEQR